MNIHIALGGAAALLMIGACAAPNNDRVDLEASRLASAQAGEEIVCSRERTTGTRLGELICRTQGSVTQNACRCGSGDRGCGASRTELSCHSALGLSTETAKSL